MATSLPRYNLDVLGEQLLDLLPESARLEAVRTFEVSREARRKVARAVVNSCTALALTIGLAPVPFADAFILLPLQAGMVTGIAYVSGRAGTSEPRPNGSRRSAAWRARGSGSAGARSSS